MISPPKVKFMKTPIDLKKVAEDFEKLSANAALLNKASDELTKQVKLINDALKSINLGISAWIQLSVTKKEERYFGYARINGKWGLAFKTRDIKKNEEIESWLFEDAPRWMRIDAVGRIPELFDALTASAEAFTERLKTGHTNLVKFAETLNPKNE